MTFNKININELKSQFLFGIVDGLNGAAGLIIGLGASHSATKIILVALLARAGSSSVSMAGAEYEADDDNYPRKVKAARVAAMGIGYLTSALLPGIGFLVSGRVGLIIFVPATALLLVLIAAFRAKTAGWAKSLTTTVGIFVLAVVAGLLASLVA